MLAGWLWFMPYTLKFSPGEKFRHLLSLVKIKFLSCVKGCIVDVRTSKKIFLQCKVAALVEIFIQRKFHVHVHGSLIICCPEHVLHTMYMYYFRASLEVVCTVHVDRCYSCAFM